MSKKRLKFKPINYEDLNARQKENYNFLKASAVLADYGFITLRLTDDWQGADFIALHKDGWDIKVQLKSRLTFQECLVKARLHVEFFDRPGKEWYLYDHNELLRTVSRKTNIANTPSWKEKGLYSINRIGPKMRAMLDKYRVPVVASPVIAPTDGVDQAEFDE